MLHLSSAPFHNSIQSLLPMSREPQMSPRNYRPKLPDACAAPPIVDMRSPTTLLTSKNLAEHRSMQTASPLRRSPSAYRCDEGLGWMHLVWHEETRRLLVI